MDLLIKAIAPTTWLGLVDPTGQVIDQLELPTDRQLATRLLADCQRLLATNDQSWSTLTGVGVWAGPGPFTALRVTHSFANGLAYGLRLPAANSADPANWQADCQRQLRTGQSRLIVPVYGAPPVRPATDA